MRFGWGGCRAVGRRGGCRAIGRRGGGWVEGGKVERVGKGGDGEAGNGIQMEKESIEGGEGRRKADEKEC